MNPIEQIVHSMNENGIRPIPDGFSTLEKMIDVAFEHAHKTLVEGDSDELVPCWSIVNNKGQTALIMTPFEDGERSKDLAAMLLKMVLQETGAIRYTFASEAWMVHGGPGEKWDGRQPSQRDDRIEVVMITGADSEKAMMKTWEIVRNDQARIVDLVPRFTNEEDVTVASGRFANLLEDVHG